MLGHLPARTISLLNLVLPPVTALVYQRALDSSHVAEAICGLILKVEEPSMLPHTQLDGKLLAMLKRADDDFRTLGSKCGVPI